MKIAAMTSRPSIGRTRIGLLNTMFSASSSLTWAGVGLPVRTSLSRCYIGRRFWIQCGRTTKNKLAHREYSTLTN